MSEHDQKEVNILLTIKHQITILSIDCATYFFLIGISCTYIKVCVVTG